MDKIESHSYISFNLWTGHQICTFVVSFDDASVSAFDPTLKAICKNW